MTRRMVALLFALVLGTPSVAEAEPMHYVGVLHAFVDGIVVFGRTLPKADLAKWARTPAFARVTDASAIGGRTIYQDKLYLVYPLAAKVVQPAPALIGKTVEIVVDRDARGVARVFSIRPK